MGTDKVKICHFTSAHKWNDVRIFVKECSSLARNGFDVTLIAPNCESQTVNGVKIIGVESIGKGRFFRMRKTTRKVYNQALEINADIYHFHDPEMLRFALRLKRLGKKVIYDVHEDVPRQILGKYWINKYLRKLVSAFFERYENRIARKLSFIIAATPFIRERFFKLNHNCIDICNYPIIGENVVQSDWGIKKNEICYIGSITEMRGIIEIISALEHVDARLNLAGEFSPIELKDKLMNSKGWNQVNNYGYVGREKIYEILSCSKIGIVTLHPAINYLDSLPIKMFEYMSSGIPVIASDFPLWKEIIEKNNCGICVDPLKPVEIANAVRKILGDDDQAKQMGSNGKKAILNIYNWEIEESKMLKVYESLS